MRIPLIVTTAACAAGLAFAGAGADQASARTVDVWQSPSGNIRCAYVDQTGVGCYTRHNQRWAFLRSFGNSAVGYSRNTLPAGRVLRYGTTWRRSTFRCSSSTAGMRCWSTYTGRGFFISRERAYRY
jgi:hypothetical protein